jgi:hypothetical protein
MLILFDHCQ